MLLLIANALAGELYLESPALDTRAAAQVLRRQAEGQDLEARVVRRYSSGVGWEYVVVVEGLPDQQVAEEAAALWAEAGGEGVSIFRREGDEGVLVSTSSAELELDIVDPARPEQDLLAAELVLRHAVRALGGQQGGRAALDRAPAIRFSYVRVVASEDGRIEAHHELLRSPDGERLRIEGVDGAVDSTTLVHPEGAWVVAGGEPVERDPERTREVLADFGPEELLAYPLEFAVLVESDPAYRLLRTASTDGEVYVLEYGGPEVGGAMTVVLEAASWHVRSVSYSTDAGTVRYGFADWREIDTGLVLPFWMELHRDGVLVEGLVVEELSVLDALAEGSLELP
ncbi:MAG TPA: hypothetical protein QGF58_06965 [Myxococcota bacterium]|nr:hypothetical protein [Myxococcota bacterium]